MIINEDHRRILEHARTFIETDEEIFICHAVMNVAVDVEGSFWFCKQITDEISIALDGCSTLDNWVGKETAGKRLALAIMGSEKLMRLAWIDRILETGKIE